MRMSVDVARQKSYCTEAPWMRGRSERAIPRAILPRTMSATRSSSNEQRVRCGLAALCGLLFGASAFWSGFYESSRWSPASLVFLAAALAVVFAARDRPSVAALAAVGGLSGLWLWSLISRGWADRADLALVAANRWALYAAIVTTLVLLVGRERRVALVLIDACSAAALGIAGYVLVRLLLPDAQQLFLGTTLNSPIGYGNAEANLLLLGFWPLVALAQDTRKRLRSAVAISAATVLGALLFAAQRRGSLLALVASGLLLLALVPGRRSRLWVLVAVLAGVSVGASSISPLFQHPDPVTGIASARTIHRAAITALLAGIGVGCVWALMLSVAAALRARGGPWTRRLTGASSAGLIALALAGSAIAGLNARSIAHRVRAQYDAFVNLSPSPGSFRLFSGGGNRYDYWRVAWMEFEHAPLRGVGAGSFTVGYFRERRTTEDVTQPHSLELQTLAELGLVGGLALLLFLGGPLFGLWRWSRRARAPGPERLVAVGAGGTFLAWLGQTSVDWVHLIPSITALALGAAVVLLCPPASAAENSVPKAGAVQAGSAARLRAVMLLGAGAAIAVAALYTARMMLADHHRAEAVALLARDPIAALAQTNDALALEGDGVDSYYARAAVLSRLGLYLDARAALLRAIAHAPQDWVSWALLGDLAIRHGDSAAATRAYRHASLLNPGVRSALPRR
jgi:O-Antigen ligase